MYTLTIDRKPYEPEKEVKVPYWAETNQGRLVIVTRLNESGATVVATVVKQYGPEDPYSVGYTMQALSLAKIKPLAEGESITIANTWEIVND